MVMSIQECPLCHKPDVKNMGVHVAHGHPGYTTTTTHGKTEVILRVDDASKATTVPAPVAPNAPTTSSATPRESQRVDDLPIPKHEANTLAAITGIKDGTGTAMSPAMDTMIALGFSREYLARVQVRDFHVTYEANMRGTITHVEVNIIYPATDGE